MAIKEKITIFGDYSFALFWFINLILILPFNYWKNYPFSHHIIKAFSAFLSKQNIMNFRWEWRSFGFRTQVYFLCFPSATRVSLSFSLKKKKQNEMFYISSLCHSGRVYSAFQEIIHLNNMKFQINHIQVYDILHNVKF